MPEPRSALAFYDFDGTLVSTNVVDQSIWCVRRQGFAKQALKLTKLLISVPFLLAIDWRSRKMFNVVFYREYRGFRKDWLEYRRPLHWTHWNPTGHALVGSLLADRLESMLPVSVDE